VTNCDGKLDQAGKPRDDAGKSPALPDTEDAGLLSEEVIDAFLSDTPAQLIRLRTLLAHQDLEGVRRVAHYLKGSAMCLGLRRMRELCQGIEMLTVLNGVQDAGDVVRLLEEECTRIRDEWTGGKRQAANSKAVGGQ